MAKLTPEIKQELKQKYGTRVYLIEDDEAGDIVFKPAPKEVWDEFVDQHSEAPQDSLRTLVDACVVFPSVEEVQKIHDDFPALADAIAQKIREKSGGRKALDAKKL